MLNIIAYISLMILIVINLRYKIQIKNIYKQLDLIKELETNKIITGSGSSREINKLINSLNELIMLGRNMSKDYKIKDKVLKETITNISHDIRTPLTSLNGYFQLLSESNDEAEKEKYMAIISTRINNLKNLLEDMFTYIKIQDHNYKIDKEECNLNKIVYDNLFSYYEDFKLKGIEPNIHIIEKPIILFSNPVYLDRIVNNLISNSLIHGKSHIGITLSQDQNSISFIVENDVENTEGIDLQNIFTRFYKKDKARTINSTGLGLTIVKELVESMGGEITASIHGDIFKIEINLICNQNFES